MSSIVLTNISWSTPSGDPLLNDINISFSHERTGLVGRNGVGKTTLLKIMAGDIQPAVGKIAKAAAIGMLCQSPELDEQDTISDIFGIREQLDVLERMVRGDVRGEELEQADWALESRLERVLSQVCLDHLDPSTPLRKLSCGQRTRVGLAALFFSDPEILLLDEPTNHMDAPGRQIVMEALREWNGCLVVASHDRTLLSEMDTIVELSSHGAKSYGGNYVAYHAQKEVELAAAEHDLAHAERIKQDVRRQAQIAAERKSRTNRQGRQLRVSGSQSKLILDSAKQRGENSGGVAARLRDKRAANAEQAVISANQQIEVLEPLSIDMPSCGLDTRRDVLKIDNIKFSYDADCPILEDVSLSIQGPERIWIVGPNGAGKSTLLSCVAGELIPQHGSVAVHVKTERLDQEISVLDQHESILNNFSRINPEATDNECYAALACFKFRGNAAHQIAGTLSGGERLRAGLACILGSKNPPQLLLLDEPSNHLDFEATATLESALRDFDGALCIVSHDQKFVQNVGFDRVLSLD
jgi:ATPase subunit of ABC transporter with duplicated ATPase domains